MTMNIFVSFRSTPYRELSHNGCKVVSGGKCSPKLAISCHYENCSYRRAVLFASQHKNINFIIVPPEYILPPNTLLTAMNYFEYLPDIKQAIESVDSFLRFEIQEDSFWTDMEMKFWKSHCRSKEINSFYTVSPSGEINKELFSPMDKNEAKYYWRLMYYTRRENYHDHAWGTYSNCYIQQCPICGKLLLISRTGLKYLIRNNKGLVCPHCEQNIFTYDKSNKGLFSFKCSNNSKSVHAIPTRHINDLLLGTDMNLLSYSPLICMSHESFVQQIALTVMFSDLRDFAKKSIKGSHLEIREYDENGKLKITPLQIMNRKHWQQ